MKIERIFLDVDDTLNSFTMFVLNRFFMCLDVSHDFDYEAYRRVLPGKRDIVEACPLLGGSEYTSDAAFWGLLPEWCWSENPVSPEFDLILDFAQEMVPRENIFLATDVTKSPSCGSGKMEWIQKVLPEWLHRNWFITPRKAQLAQGPGDLLIDDSENACRRFCSRGGRAILVARPWNCKYPIDTATDLRYRFESLRSNT